jgi:hypothetical protein
MSFFTPYAPTVLTLRGLIAPIPLGETTFLGRALLTHEVASADALPCNLAEFNFCQGLTCMGTRLRQMEAVFALNPTPDFFPFAGDGQGPT